METKEIITTYTEKVPEAILSPYRITDDADFAVAFVLKQIGLSGHVQGYYYLKRAIRITVNNPEEAQLITKVVYPAVAKEFKTSIANVEKAIRVCVKKINCSDETKLAYIGWVSNSYTNKQVIASIAELISMNLANK